MNNSVLVIGGGIAGIQASLDLANMGFHVDLVEKSPSIGGRMAQLDKTFPTNDCAMCILAPKMIECSGHENVTLVTYSQVVSVEGELGNFNVKVRKNPRYIDEEKCTGCGECAKVCPVEVISEFDEGLGSRKAIYIPFPQAIPNKYTIDQRGYPPCRVACPAGVNAQGYIALISQGKFREALEVVRRTMPFAGVCGRVCQHPCETDCERGTIDQPLAIASLKRFLADYELKEGGVKATPVEKTREQKVAIVGSGPAGLACAYDLAREGYPVTVFEAMPQPGGLLRYGIPEYRLPRRILDNEIDYVRDTGVEIKTNTPVKDVDELFKQGYQAVFLGTGAPKSRRMNIPGEDARGVMHAMNFLKIVNSGVKVPIGDRVAVIGGGNAAIDAARVALRLGAKQVSIVYRRSRKEMPAVATEVEAAEQEGVILHFLATPVRVLTENNRVQAIECTRMELGEPDASGRRRPVPIPDSEFVIELDNVIMALGQVVDRDTLPKELEYTRAGTILANPITLQTSIEGVFAGGDVVSVATGPSSVIDAIAAGKEAATSINRYLRGIDLGEDRPVVLEKVKQVAKQGIISKPRAAMLHLKGKERTGSFTEVELGFDEKAAIEEAKRCLNCAVCSDCRECEKICEAKAIDHDMHEEYLDLDVDAIIVSTGLDLYDASKLTEYGYGRIKNVITGLEYERLTNASGPTKGELERPSDGKIPSNIGFIQCVGSRDFKNNPYCCSVCCMHATKEAIMAYEHHSGTKSTIFYMDLRAVGKRFQEYVARARDEANVTYVRARPGKIEVNRGTQNPIIWYEDTTIGETKSLETELVVLCQTLIPSQGIKELADMLGINVDEHGFVEIPDNLSHPLDTNRPGIFVCGYAHSPRDIPDSVIQASGAAGRVAEAVATARVAEAVTAARVAEHAIVSSG